MKVVSSQQMTEMEAQAYRDGASETDFMEEAGSGIALVVHDYVEDYDIDPHVILLCGKGNNAGDAYVAGVHLLHLDYKVEAYQMAPLSECSPLCKQNASRFGQDGGGIIEMANVDDLEFPSTGIVIDGLFGTGFRGAVDEPYASLIRKANRSGLPLMAIDIPSGLHGETGVAEGDVIRATKTIFLGLPKSGFFLNKGWDHVGKLHYVDFGLGQEYIETTEADFLMLSPDMVRPFIPNIRPSRHKYEAGLVVGLAGSPGMPGAAILSTLSALRGGAGMVKLLHPNHMQAELSASPYELIKIPYQEGDADKILEHLNAANATFIGPGIGRTEETRTLLTYLLPKLNKPTIIDADALTLIAEENLPIPKEAILTPHIGELSRLLGKKLNGVVTPEFLKECQKYTEKHSITLILKGGPTYLFHPKQPLIVSPFGDPGMATAGSGDVLTGLLASFLAQGLKPYHTAQLALYLHGTAGEEAASEFTSPCMIASDIIDYFPDAFDTIL